MASGAIASLTDEQTVRIAAERVIVRPVNAVKELLENSLDAGARSIRVQLLDGGLKSVTVSDDGRGIKEEHLVSLCERYKTTKLKAYKDLPDVSTYGFRGEALACLSHMARDLTISSRTEDEEGWEAHYRNGKVLRQEKIGTFKVGTTVTVKEMFAQRPSRGQVLLKSPSMEAGLVLSLIQNFAINFPMIEFHMVAEYDAALQRKSSHKNLSMVFAAPRVVAPCDDVNVARRKRIERFFGQSDNILRLKDIKVEGEQFTCNGLMTGLYNLANCQNIGRTSTSMGLTSYCMFVNDRSVDWPMMKSAIQSMYKEASSGKESINTFVHLSITLSKDLVDANADPTKSQFVCYDESNVVRVIVQHIKSALTESQTKVPSSVLPTTNTSQQQPSKIVLPKIDAQLFRENLKSLSLVGMIHFGIFVVSFNEALLCVDCRRAIRQIIALHVGSHDGLIHWVEVAPPLEIDAELLPSVNCRMLKDGKFLAMVPRMFSRPSVPLCVASLLTEWEEETQLIVDVVNLTEKLYFESIDRKVGGSHLKAHVHAMHWWNLVLSVKIENVRQCKSLSELNRKNETSNDDSIAIDFCEMANMTHLLKVFERCGGK